MLFDLLRHSRTRLAAAFTFGAALGLNGLLPPEDAQSRQLRQLAAEYNTNAAFMPPARREAFLRLMRQERETPAGQMAAATAGLCAHGAGGTATTGGAAMTACPVQRRRRLQGDMSHLLAMHHWI